MVALKKTINIITTVIMVLVLAFAFLMVGMRIFGLTPYVVLSGSMEPNIPTGSVIYVAKAGIRDLEIGDPITYHLNDLVVTHRIVDIIVDEDNPTSVSYKVKGDANNVVDGTPIPFENVIGEEIFHIPYLGFAFVFIRTPQGVAMAISLIVLLITLTFIPDMLIKLLTEEAAAAEASARREDISEAEKMLRQLREEESAEGNSSDEPKE
jgi:signal peptidase